MNKELHEELEKHITPEFRKLAENFMFKLNQIVSLTSEAESLYILNLTLQVINRKFEDSK